MASDPVVHPTASRKGGAGKWRTWISLGKDPVTGRWRSKSKVYWADGKRDAIRIAAELEAEVVKAAGKDLTAATFNQLIDRYLADDPDELRPTTRTTYTQYLKNHIRKALGTKRIIDLQTTDFADLRSTLLAGGLSPSSVNQCLAISRSVCRYGVEGLGWLSTNPAKIRRAKMSKQDVTATHIGDYHNLVDRLEQSDQHQLRTLIQMAAMTGARRGELCGLRWGDLRNGELTIERTVDEKRNLGPTKTHATRTIPLQPAALEVLAWWSDHQLTELAEAEGLDRRSLEDDWYIWPDLEPSVPSRPGVYTEALADEAVKLQGLRHLAATLMIGAGIDPRAAANRMGHSSPTMTADVYAASSTARDVAAGDSIGKALER